MNLNDPSTRKRTLLGFPVRGKTKWHDLEDDLNAIPGILVATPRPHFEEQYKPCLLYTSPSPRDATLSRMPSSA